MPRSAPMFRSVLILPVLALASACAEPGAGPAPSPEAPPSASASVSGLPAGTEQCAAVQPQAQPLIDLCVLSSDAMEGRLVGTEASARARAYLEQRFAEVGLEPVGAEGYAHAFDFQRPMDFRDPESPRQTLTGYNLIGRIAGTEPGPALIVTAHYDHVGPGENGEIFNGADDNASGVAAILAVASALRETPPMRDVLIIAFDAEEGGLHGARAFVANPPAGVEIGLNVNLDMLGYSPDRDIWVAGTYHTPALLPVVEAAAAAETRISLFAGYDRPTGDPREDWTLLSDHGPFHAAGHPFLYLGVEDHEHYHQPSDEFETIDPGFFLPVVDLSVDLARRADGWLATQ